ncbi:14958_t:CDS:2, partial [Rhizophagus irregularis]
YRRVNAFNIATPEASTTTPASTSEIIAIVFNPNENMRPDLLHRFTQLSIFVPNRLRPYIPSQPIYSPEDAIYYAPSSTGWFKYLEKKVKSAAKAAINQQEPMANDLTTYQESYHQHMSFFLK